MVSLFFFFSLIFRTRFVSASLLCELDFINRSLVSFAGAIGGCIKYLLRLIIFRLVGICRKQDAFSVNKFGT